MVLFYWIYNIEMILCVKCIVDCGFLKKIGIDLSGIVCEDVIGICRRMYVWVRIFDLYIGWLLEV